MSSHLMDSSKPSRIFSIDVTSNTPGRFAADAITFRHSTSTAAKRRASVGSWRVMSAEEKIGSRYSHVRCTASHASSTFEM